MAGYGGRSTLATESAAVGVRAFHQYARIAPSRYPVGMSAVIERYLASQARQLRESFDRIRSTHHDRDVKGGKNEQIVAEFLRAHTAGKTIVTNTDVLDAHGNQSGELDAVVCNEHQPFPGTHPEHVLVDGVDVCVQVKAVLTDEELDRSIKNCLTLKRLRRSFNQGDGISAAHDIVPYIVERVPYFVLAFDSKLAFDEIARRLASKIATISAHDQPDLIALLGRGLVLNCRTGQPFGLMSTADPITGIAALEYGEATLREFLRWVHTLSIRIDRRTSPLTNYFGPITPQSSFRVGTEASL